MQVSAQRLRIAFGSLLAVILINGFLVWQDIGSLADGSALVLFTGRFQSNVACTILPSTQESLRVELCYSTVGCNVGTVVITAPVSHCSSGPRESADPDQLPDSYLAPHVFQLQLYGAARTALRAEAAIFLGARRCAWRIAFDARTVGSIGFQVDHLRMNAGNTSVHLLESDFQPLIQTSTSSQDPASNTAGTTSREAAAFYPTVNMCNVENVPTTVRKAHAQTVAPCANGSCAASSNLTCSRQRPVRGVYRPAHELDLQEGARSAVTYQGYVWEPESSCTMDGLPHAYTRPDELEDLLNKHERRVVFIGDSHARYAYHLLGSWYSQNWTYLMDPSGTKDMTPWSRGRVKFDFVLDALLSRIPAAARGNCTAFLEEWEYYDTFVLSAGHHLAITDIGSTPVYPREVTTTEEYVARVYDNVQALLHACGRSPAPRIIWLGTPAFAPSVNSRAKPWKDHRTNTRLSVWTRRAEDMLRRDLPSVALIDQYSLTLPWIHHTSDGLHFFRTDAAYAIVQELNHKIGLGRASGWWHVYKDARDD